MIYELLTGRTPYQGALPHAVPYMRNKVDPEPPSTVNPSLPSALDRIVLQALTKKPQDRFASVKEFASAFAGVLKPNAAQPSGAKQMPKATPAPDPKQLLPAKWYQKETEEILEHPDAHVHMGRPLRKSGYLWAVGIGIVAGGISIVPILIGVTNIFIVPLISSFLWIAGLVTGKITKQAMMGWIPGITPVVLLFTITAAISNSLSDPGKWAEIIVTGFIAALICGLISFWGAAFATRKPRK